jgi:hypothetical protein
MTDAQKSEIKQLAAQIASGIVTGHSDSSHATTVASISITLALEIQKQVEALSG